MKNRVMYPLLGMVILLCLGTIYSWSIFKKPLETMFSVGASESALPFSIFLVAFAVTMPFAGILMGKIGPKMTTILGGLLVGSGWILAGFASNMMFITLVYGIVAGAGVGIAYGAPLAVAAKWFPDRKGLALGVTLVGFGLSPFITAPIAKALIDGYGPLVAFKSLGFAFLIIITLAALPLRFPKEGEVAAAASAGSADAGPSLTWKEMIKTKQFLGLWLCYTIGTLVGLMAISISKPAGQEMIGAGAGAATFMVSMFAVFNGGGRPLFGFLTDKFGAKAAAMVSYVIIIAASGLTFLFSQGSTALYFVSFALLWMILGGWLAIAPAATCSFFGLKNYAQNYGFVFTAYGAGAFCGPLLAGLIRDSLGSYLNTFYFTIALAVAGMIIAQVTFSKK